MRKIFTFLFVIFIIISGTDFSQAKIKLVFNARIHNNTVTTSTDSIRIINNTSNWSVAITNNYYEITLTDIINPKLESNALSYPYPNPFGDYIYCDIQSDKPSQVRYEIIDESGKSIISEIANICEGTNHLKIELPRLPSGVYFMSLLNRTFKLVRTDGIGSNSSVVNPNNILIPDSKETITADDFSNDFTFKVYRKNYNDYIMENVKISRDTTFTMILEPILSAYKTTFKVFDLFTNTPIIPDSIRIINSTYYQDTLILGQTADIYTYKAYYGSVNCKFIIYKNKYLNYTLDNYLVFRDTTITAKMELVPTRIINLDFVASDIITGKNVTPDSIKIINLKTNKSTTILNQNFKINLYDNNPYLVGYDFICYRSGYQLDSLHNVLISSDNRIVFGLKPKGKVYYTKCTLNMSGLSFRRKIQFISGNKSFPDIKTSYDTLLLSLNDVLTNNKLPYSKQDMLRMGCSYSDAYNVDNTVNICENAYSNPIYPSGDYDIRCSVKKATVIFDIVNQKVTGSIYLQSRGHTGHTKYNLGDSGTTRTDYDLNFSSLDYTVNSKKATISITGNIKALFNVGVLKFTKSDGNYGYEDYNWIFGANTSELVTLVSVAPDAKITIELEE